MDYGKRREVAKELVEKYHLPKQVESNDAEGKEFSYFINNEHGCAIVFADNTYTYMRITGDHEYGYDLDEDRCGDVELIELFQPHFRQAYIDIKHWEKEENKREEQERKLKMYKKLQEEFGSNIQ